jgi:hypothetical protein
MTGDELTSHLNVWHESALAKGEAGLPHGMSPAVASAYEAYHRQQHRDAGSHLDHWHRQDGTAVKSFIMSLSCGCEQFINGRPTAGGYIGCPAIQHQGTYKILAVREQA